MFIIILFSSYNKYTDMMSIDTDMILLFINIIIKYHDTHMMSIDNVI